MDPVTGIVAAQAIQGVTKAAGALLGAAAPADTEKIGTPKKPESDEFSAMLKGLLKPDQANSINEEELFAAVIHERIVSLKGEEAGAQFKEAFEAQKSKLTRADGYVNVEQAAENALQQTIEKGTLTSDEGLKIRQESFRAAQLDDNHAALYDGRGAGHDPTIATANIEAAVEKARAILQKIQNGELDVSSIGSAEEADAAGGSVSTDTVTASGGNVDGPNGGFLFKPEADHSGKLVVLLPEAMGHKVESVLLKDKDGKVVEEGSSSGYANGNREHWRFDRTGADYPKNIEVVVKFENGEKKIYKIDDPSKRYD